MIMVMYTSLKIGVLYLDIIYYARRESSTPRAERVSGAANNISDRCEAKAMGILSNAGVNRAIARFSRVSAIYYIISE